MKKLNYNWQKQDTGRMSDFVYICNNIKFNGFYANATMILNVDAGDTIETKMAFAICMIEGNLENSGMTKGHFRSVQQDAQDLLLLVEHDENWQIGDHREPLKKCYLQYIFVDKLPHINELTFGDIGFVGEGGIGS